MDIFKNLFAPIEKLITEHGSASILREHINLLKEKFSLLEKENSSLKEEKEILSKKNRELKSQLEKATNEIESLKKLNQELQRATDQKKKEIDKVAEQILIQFFKAGQELPVQHFVSSLSLDINTVKYHFDILLENNLVELAAYGSSNPLIDARFGGDSSTPDTYQITPKGRKYIVENSLT